MTDWMWFYENPKEAAKAFDKLQKEFDEFRSVAIAETSSLARQLGEAEGRLYASEMVGVVDGWKERCFTAEKRAEQLQSKIAKMSLENADLANHLEDAERKLEYTLVCTCGQV